MAAHTRPGRRIAMAWSDRLAADLGSPVRPMLAHILAWASTRPISTIEILDWVDPLSVSPRSATHRHCRRWLAANVSAAALTSPRLAVTGSAGAPEAVEPGAQASIMMGLACGPLALRVRLALMRPRRHRHRHASEYYYSMLRAAGIRRLSDCPCRRNPPTQ